MAEVVDLRLKLSEATEALRAIRDGETDTMIIDGKSGVQIFTLAGPDQPYRVLIERMNEGAITVDRIENVSYANKCFAAMVKKPLEEVLGGSIRRFMTAEDADLLVARQKASNKSGSKLRIELVASDKAKIPVQVSFHALPRQSRWSRTTGMVITDLTEATRMEHLLRLLTRRMLQTLDDERERVARELHENITQLICAAQFRCQALVARFAPNFASSRSELVSLGAMLGKTVLEIERVSQQMGPHLLKNLGLAAALKAVAKDFQQRTRIPVAFKASKKAFPISVHAELAMFRIFQEAMRNIERHAAASNVIVQMAVNRNGIELFVGDDGTGFDQGKQDGSIAYNNGLGLLGMSEQALHLNGFLKITSSLGAGTQLRLLFSKA